MSKRKVTPILRIILTTIAVLILIPVIFAVLRKSDKLNQSNNTPTPSPTLAAPTVTAAPVPADTPTPSPVSTPDAEEKTDLFIRTDYEQFNPNEVGEIPIIMFHRFIEAYEPNTEKDYTTTFSEFENLLQTLYDKGFRLISMQDFIDCNISVPAGTMPMVFSFDDGTSGQFNLIRENGELKVNPKSAVGIMIAFNEKHPDFGLKGIFYVNMDIGDNTFKGEGTLRERFEFMEKLGLEIGSHTWGHVNFTEMKSSEKIQEAIGKNQEKAEEILPGLRFYSMALPYGSRPSDKSLRVYLKDGFYNNMEYHHETIMAVGAEPSVPSISKNYDSLYVRRVRAQGRVAVDGDLTWWLPKMTPGRMFVSDGDPTTIVVPEAKAEKVDMQRVSNYKLIIY